MSWKDNLPQDNRYYETDDGILYNCGCLENIKNLPDKWVKLIIVDAPPNFDLLESLSFECERILKTDGTIYLLCGFRYSDVFKKLFERYFNLQNIIVWERKTNQTFQNLKEVYELILMGTKSNKFYFKGEHLTNVWKIKAILDNDAESVGHKAQLPLKLIKRMIRISTQKEDVVLDPFLGSGTTAVVCEELNRRWIGIEKEKKYCKIIKERLNIVQKSLF